MSARQHALAAAKIAAGWPEGSAMAVSYAKMAKAYHALADALDRLHA